VGTVIDLLVDNEFLLLFLVLGLGYLLGRVRVRGFRLGVSAVLFVGLAFGALSERITVPEVVYQLGLVVFVYTVGVAAGPAFVGSLRRRALGVNVLVVVVLASAAALALGLGSWAGASPGTRAGVFTGATTNTPALAAVLQAESDATDPGAVVDPVLGYSVAYPFGVLGMILAVWAVRRVWRGELAASRDDELVNLTVRVTRPEAAGRTVAEVMREHEWAVVLSRVRRGDEAEVPLGHFTLALDDLVVVVGPADAADAMARALGERWPEELPLDRSDLDVRRMFVSATDPIGERIVDLRLPERFGAIVTRVRRGDADRLARPTTVLEPGDRVRVVAPRERMDEVTAFFGDSYRAISEIDVASFSLGLVAGLLLGLVPVPMPGGETFRLGLAGGPLVVGLVLGALERTGPITWQIPYNANLTLRQFGRLRGHARLGRRDRDARGGRRDDDAGGAADRGALPRPAPRAGGRVVRGRRRDADAARRPRVRGRAGGRRRPEHRVRVGVPGRHDREDRPRAAPARRVSDDTSAISRSLSGSDGEG
jgi:putative transport protein